jgi:hypothetical protein
MNASAADYLLTFSLLITAAKRFDAAGLVRIPDAVQRKNAAPLVCSERKACPLTI